MADSVYRVTELVGTSATSWEAAAKAAVETAAKTLRDLRVAEVVRQDVTIENGKVSTYRVTCPTVRALTRRDDLPACGEASFTFYGAVAAWTWHPAAFISSSACCPVSGLTAAQRLRRTRTWTSCLRASSAVARTQ